MTTQHLLGGLLFLLATLNALAQPAALTDAERRAYQSQLEQFAGCGADEHANYSLRALAYLDPECLTLSPHANEVAALLENISGAEPEAQIRYAYSATLPLLRAADQLGPAAAPLANALACEVTYERQGFALSPEQFPVVERHAQACADLGLDPLDEGSDRLTIISNRMWGYSEDDGTYNLMLDPIWEAAGQCRNKPLLETLDCNAQSCDAARRCDTALKTQIAPALSVFGLMKGQVALRLNQPYVESLKREYSDRHKRWKNYLQGTGFQYEWELALNNWRSGNYVDVADGREPPNQRWVLLHPTVAALYGQDLPDGDQVAMAGVVKLIGHKWWNGFGADQQPRHLRGVSLIASLADLPELDDVGYGAMVEYKGWSVGYADHGDDGVWLISTDVAGLLASKPDSLPGWLKKLAPWR